MLKKMLLLAMAVGALVAFAAPAAMAETVITDTEEAPASTITAFSSNLKSTTAVGILDCNEVDITGNVTNGTPATISEIHGTAKSNVSPFSAIGECPVRNAEGTPITGARVTSIGGHASLENGSATADFDFSYDVTVAAGVFLSGCTFQVTDATLPYNAAGVITFSKVAMVGSGPTGCSTTGELNGELDIDGSVDG